jgi:hypothetical protein
MTPPVGMTLPWFFFALPDGAAIDWSHWLAGLAGECFLEFGEIAHHPVGAELFRRMAVSLHPQPQILRTVVLAPVLSEGNEELLLRG